MGGGENPVELREAQFLDWIVLVHEEADRVQESEMAVRATAYGNAERIVLKLSAKSADVVGPELARNKDQIQVALHQFLRTKTARVGWRDVNLDAGVIPLKCRNPHPRQARQHV